MNATQIARAHLFGCETGRAALAWSWPQPLKKRGHAAHHHVGACQFAHERLRSNRVQAITQFRLRTSGDQQDSRTLTTRRLTKTPAQLATFLTWHLHVRYQHRRANDAHTDIAMSSDMHCAPRIAHFEDVGQCCAATGLSSTTNTRRLSRSGQEPR